jgi:hypothetical protein
MKTIKFQSTQKWNMLIMNKLQQTKTQHSDNQGVSQRSGCSVCKNGTLCGVSGSQNAAKSVPPQSYPKSGPSVIPCATMA